MSKRYPLTPLDAPIELLRRAATKASLVAGAEARTSGVDIAAREGELVDRVARNARRFERTVAALFSQQQEQLAKEKAKVAAEKKARELNSSIARFRRSDLHDE